MPKSESILVTYPLPDLDQESDQEWRVDLDDLLDTVELSTDVLSRSAKSFIQTIGAIISDVDSEIASFGLSEVEVSAVVTIGGEISLLSFAKASAEGGGGLKFVFKKRTV